MLIRPIDYFLLAWFVLAALSTAYVAYDQYRNNPEPPVMKWGFILVTLYTGPFGLLLYVLADKEPRPGEHERFIAPLWKQGVGSTIHCVAGDATGIILAAVIRGVALVRAEHVSLRGTLRIAMSGAFGIREVIPRLPAFVAQHPKLRIELLISDRTEDLVAEGADSRRTSVKRPKPDSSSLRSFVA